MTEVPSASPGTEPPVVAEIIRESGCVVVRGLLAGDELAAVRQTGLELVETASLGDNEFDGFRTRRVFDPLARTRGLDGIAAHPLVLDVVSQLLGSPYQFGMTILSQLGPGEVGQRPHRDAGVYPLPAEFPDVMVNTIWALDDFTAENGATRVAPGSHLSSGSTEKQVLLPAEMEVGSVLVYSGRLVHAAGANDTEGTRLGLIVEHIVRWLRPGDAHTLTVGREAARGLSPELRELLGYNQASPYLGFIGGRPPAEWLDETPDTARRP